LAAAVDIAGVHGVVRAEWNPAFGFAVVPLVFLARFHGPSVILFVGAFAMFSIGGESASRKADLPNFFVLVMVALMLIFLAISEFLQARSRNVVTHE
jgi:simple sugar transport system permease protein